MAAFLPQEIIRKIRDGKAATTGEIASFVRGLTGGEVGEGQAAAFAMAVFCRGLTTEATVALTEAMRDSGKILHWPDDGRPVLDKHSTGGIGDNVSLVLAPILAACGARVPMISGRGLGHTGGTLDKLDAIPGYRSAPDLTTMRRVVDETGCAIVAATAELAPADRRLYAIRDVTATVDSLPLIVSSILSKKLAAGTDALVLDVKLGSGAFMTTLEDAEKLARSLVTVANGAGLKTTALITDMNEPLASAAGNAVEVANAVGVLTSAKNEPRLEEAALTLASDLLHHARLAATIGEAEAMARGALRSGAAAERFGQMVHALGGPVDFVERGAGILQSAPVRLDVFAETDGSVAAIETRMVGLAVISLGGGRTRASDVIDHSVGFTDLARIGETIDRSRPIGIVHARDEASAKRAADMLRAAYTFGDGCPFRSVVRFRMERNGTLQKVGTPTQGQ